MTIRNIGEYDPHQNDHVHDLLQQSVCSLREILHSAFVESVTTSPASGSSSRRRRGRPGKLRNKKSRGKNKILLAGWIAAANHFLDMCAASRPDVRSLNKAAASLRRRGLKLAELKEALGRVFRSTAWSDGDIHPQTLQHPDSRETLRRDVLSDLQATSDVGAQGARVNGEVLRQQLDACPIGWAYRVIREQLDRARQVACKAISGLEAIVLRNGTPITTLDGILEAHADEFEKSSRRREIDPTEFILRVQRSMPRASRELNLWCHSIREIDAAIDAVGENKATGPDNINPSLLKRCRAAPHDFSGSKRPAVVLHLLRGIYNLMLRTGV